jgi:hypothetical protein
VKKTTGVRRRFLRREAAAEHPRLELPLLNRKGFGNRTLRKSLDVFLPGQALAKLPKA